MRAASSVGLLKYLGQNRFGLSGRGQLSRLGVPGSLREMAMIQTAHAQWQCWGLLPDAVREGRSQATRALGADCRLLRERRKCRGGSTFRSRHGKPVRAHCWACRHDGGYIVCVGSSTLVDQTETLLGVNGEHSVLRGQVVDLPHVVAGAEQEARRRGRVTVSRQQPRNGHSDRVCAPPVPLLQQHAEDQPPAPATQGCSPLTPRQSLRLIHQRRRHPTHTMYPPSWRHAQQ